MEDIGKQFGEGEVYLPEVLMSARAMKEAMAMILPILSASNFEPVGKFAIGTVKGDVHDIGKNIVIAVFTGSGFQVTDLGIDVPAEKFVEAVEQGAQVIGMSALIGPTMPNMKVVIDTIEEAGLRSKVKIVVGGALVTQEFADKIGADAYAKDAFSGVDMAKALLLG
jgi:5-methyltetrahydrofolate--homocysteine methyltransferase